jgi:predicted XRE-type DNA-binding protein
MIQEIVAYKKIMMNIDESMNKSPFKKNHIIETVGISAPTFYRKLKTQTFTADEMLSIAKILSPEEAYIMELKEELAQADLDYKEGRVYKHEDVIRDFRKIFKQDL